MTVKNKWANLPQNVSSGADQTGSKHTITETDITGGLRCINPSLQSWMPFWQYSRGKGHCKSFQSCFSDHLHPHWRVLFLEENTLSAEHEESLNCLRRMKNNLLCPLQSTEVNPNEHVRSVWTDALDSALNLPECTHQVAFNTLDSPPGHTETALAAHGDPTHYWDT